MWKKISKTDFTTAATVSIDNCFSASYTHYLVVRNLLGSAADVTLGVRVRVSSTDDSGANYREQRVYAASTTVGGSRSTGQTVWTWASGYTEIAAFGYVALKISNPFEAVRTTAWADVSYGASGSIEMLRTVMAHDLTTSYTGFTVIPGSGTITGSITVYGLKES